MKSFLCLGGNQYEFEGWKFELHAYCGPALIDDDGNPINQEPPAEFWSAFEAFQLLSDAELKGCLLRSGGVLSGRLEYDDPGWVSVDDHLPDPVTDARINSSLVLIAIEKNNPDPFDTAEVRIGYYDYRRAEWRLAMCSIPAPTVPEYERVTHWMPVPEPPPATPDKGD